MRVVRHKVGSVRMITAAGMERRKTGLEMLFAVIFVLCAVGACRRRRMAGVAKSLTVFFSNVGLAPAPATAVVQPNVHVRYTRNVAEVLDSSRQGPGTQ